MPIYKIGSVTVQFPYQAYDSQLVYMGKVIEALQRGQNGLLESPTGTGKTLCLLCATLAWRASLAPGRTASLAAPPGSSPPGPDRDNDRPSLSPLGGGDRLTLSPWGGGASSQPGDADVPGGKKKLPTIVYASRTHSQLHQVVRELKATQYRPRMVVLGSRDQMCIHADFAPSLRGAALNQACRAAVKVRSCDHHRKAAEYLRLHPDLGVATPVDIEDLVKIGRTDGPCPYYVSRELHESAELILVPYNYVIDKDNRQSLKGIQWEDSVLIFDEAHNLEGICADAASLDLKASLLAACIGEAKQCVELALSEQSIGGATESSCDPDTFAVLKGLLLALEKQIAEVAIGSAEEGLTRPGSYMLEFLGGVNITHATLPMLLDTIDHAVLLLGDAASSRGVAGGQGGTSFRLQALHSALRLIFRGTDPAYTHSFKTHIQELVGGTGGNQGAAGRFKKASNRGRTLSWWCFDPGLTMTEIKRLGVRSILLTSGTLSPLDSFAHELRLPFEVRLENPHVIAERQIWVGVVPVGPSGKALNSSFRTRSSPEYKLELGNAIVNFARIVPDGLLVFFPSYHLLEACIEAWQALSGGATAGQGGAAATVWERISRFKQPVIEPRESAQLSAASEDFMAKLNDSSSDGAIFFAVCRGKVSEGLDFADKAGRGVIMTGIPYAQKTDPKVRLKRAYLDEQIALASANANKRESKGLTGEQWYVQAASRAVNQAVGRVIRHRHDFGAIILCDERFQQSQAINQMSLWLRPYIKSYAKFGDAAFTLTRFFRGQAATGGGPTMAQMKGGPAAANQVAADGEGSMGSPRVQAHFMDVPQRNFQKLPAIRESVIAAAGGTGSGAGAGAGAGAEAGWVAPAPQGKGLLASMQRHLSHPPPHGSGSPNNDGMLAPAMRASLTGGGGRVSSQGQSLSAMLAAQRQVSSSYAALAEGVVSAANEATRGAPPSRSMPGGTSTSGSVPGGNVLARQVAQSSREDEGAPPPPLVVGPAHVLAELRQKAARGSSLGERASCQSAAATCQAPPAGSAAAVADVAAASARGAGGEGAGGSKIAGGGVGQGRATGGAKTTSASGGGVRDSERGPAGGEEQVTRDGTGTGTRAAGGRAEPEHAPGGKGRGREGTTVGAGPAAARSGGEGAANSRGHGENGSGGGTNNRGGGANGKRGGVPGKGSTAGNPYGAQVKASLSVGEFASFQRALRAYKGGALSVEGLLDAVAGLFRAPERYSLLLRFGAYLGAENQGLLKTKLAAHLGAPPPRAPSPFSAATSASPGARTTAGTPASARVTPGASARAAGAAPGTHASTRAPLGAVRARADGATYSGAANMGAAIANGSKSCETMSVTGNGLAANGSRQRGTEMGAGERAAKRSKRAPAAAGLQPSESAPAKRPAHAAAAGKR